MSLCVLSNNEHQQELHRQAYQEFHTHKQASVLKIVDALLAIEVYFINEETAAGKGGGSQVVAKYPKQFRFSSQPGRRDAESQSYMQGPPGHTACLSGLLLSQEP